MAGIKTIKHFLINKNGIIKQETECFSKNKHGRIRNEVINLLKILLYLSISIFLFGKIFVNLKHFLIHMSQVQKKYNQGVIGGFIFQISVVKGGYLSKSDSIHLSGIGGPEMSDALFYNNNKIGQTIIPHVGTGVPPLWS